MGSLSIWHWLIVLLVVVLIFGTNKLRNIGSDLGGAVRGFKDGMKGAEDKPEMEGCSVRKVLLSVAAVILGALAPMAASQESAKAAPASAFAVLHYDLKTGITPATRSLQTTAGVTIESRAAGLRTLRLYLHREFTVRQVADAGRALALSQPADTGDKLVFSPEAVPLEIDLGRDLAKGERVTLVIDYGGPISKTINNVNVISPALTELAGYAAWFPKEKENGAFTYELALTLPVDHTVAVTDGREVSASPSATTNTRVFKRDDRGTCAACRKAARPCGRRRR